MGDMGLLSGNYVILRRNLKFSGILVLSEIKQVARSPPFQTGCGRLFSFTVAHDILFKQGGTSDLCGKNFISKIFVLLIAFHYK